MSVENFKAIVWSARLALAFRKRFVFGSVTNRDWQGDINGSGGSVKITTPSPISVGNTASTIVYEEITSTQQTLTISEDKTWGFTVEDLDAVQAMGPDKIDTYMTEAAQALADEVDQYLAGLYTESGLTNIDLDVGADDFYDALVLAGQRLSEKNVPKEGRWVIVTPKGHADLQKNDSFIHATQSGDDVIANGRVGRAAGFTIYESNNVANSGDDYFYVYGTNAAITFADQLVKTEALRDVDTWKDYVRGRYVYGAKVVRPFSLGVITADES
jgi:hypothetical protein